MRDYKNVRLKIHVCANASLIAYISNCITANKQHNALITREAAATAASERDRGVCFCPVLTTTLLWYEIFAG